MSKAENDTIRANRVIAAIEGHGFELTSGQKDVLREFVACLPAAWERGRPLLSDADIRRYLAAGQA